MRLGIPARDRLAAVRGRHEWWQIEDETRLTRSSELLRQTKSPLVLST
jgi:hypothetical protein